MRGTGTPACCGLTGASTRRPARARRRTTPGPGCRRRRAPPCPNATGVARTSTAASRCQPPRRRTRRSRPRLPPPGPCRCGTRHPPDPGELRRSSATRTRTVDSATLAPSSTHSRCHTRRAVCRCLRGASKSSVNHRRTVPHAGPTPAPPVAPSSAAADSRRPTPDAPGAGARDDAPPACGSTAPRRGRPAGYVRTTPLVTAPLPDLHAGNINAEIRTRGGARIRDDTPATHPAAITTQTGPESVKNNRPAGASSGDHTHAAQLLERGQPTGKEADQEQAPYPANSVMGGICVQSAAYAAAGDTGPEAELIDAVPARVEDARI